MMLAKTKITPVTITLFALFSLALMACGGGGGGGDAAPAPSLQVLPANFDFGSVTDGNTVSPLEVTLRNAGAVSLSVSDIALSNATDFSLDITGGAQPCGSSAPTIAAGASCTVMVEFMPPPPPAFATYSADLTIRSNDPTTPVFNLALLGTLEEINAINVKINQIEACPRPATATVYVSVTDQGGFPVRTLDVADFGITENGVNKTTTTAVSVDDTVTLSVSLLMDYSGSIRMEPDNVTDMENAAISFINQLGANDEAEIIKYATTIEVTQAFTSSANSPLLINAIQSTPNIGSSTALYDAIVLATDNLSTRAKDRRAIIVITDGMDRDGSGGQLSINGLDDVIADANDRGVPVFTVGLGSADVTVLQQIANDTGGTFSDSTTSDNLATIYQQLADLLFTDQYILTYASTLADDVTGDLSVTAAYSPSVTGSDTKTITVCP